MENYLASLEEDLGNHMGIADRFLLNQLYEEEYRNIKRLNNHPKYLIAMAEFSAFCKFLEEFGEHNKFYEEYQGLLRNIKF